MSAKHLDHPPSVLPGAEHLRALAEVLHRSFATLTRGDPPFIVRVVVAPLRPTGFELGVLPLRPGDHATDALLGYTAPQDHVVIGVVSTGRQHVDDGGGDPDPVRLTALFGRSGASVVLLSPPGQRPASAGDIRHLEAPGGELADTCRRALGLPTGPPATGLDHWLATRWLDRLLARVVADPDRRLTWRQAAALHPLAVSGPIGGPGTIARVTAAMSGGVGWEGLRAMVAEGRGHLSPPLDREVVAWMDAGMFSRWLVGAELPPGLLLTELAALAPPDVVADVVRGLPPALRPADVA